MVMGQVYIDRRGEVKGEGKPRKQRLGRETSKSEKTKPRGIEARARPVCEPNLDMTDLRRRSRNMESEREF